MFMMTWQAEKYNPTLLRFSIPFELSIQFSKNPENVYSIKIISQRPCFLDVKNKSSWNRISQPQYFPENMIWSYLRDQWPPNLQTDLPGMYTHIDQKIKKLALILFFSVICQIPSLFTNNP